MIADTLATLYMLGALPFLASYLFKLLFVIAATTLIGQLTQRGEPETPPDAKGIAITDNPTDPNAPPPVVYGAPWWRLPLLMQYVSPTLTNTVWPSPDQRITRTFHAGAGPNDGGDLQIRSGGDAILTIVTTDAPAALRTLEPDAARVEWMFPSSSGPITLASVVIYKDGVLYGTATEGDGAFIAIGSYTTRTAMNVSPRTFTSTDDATILSAHTRVGGFLADDGRVENLVVKIMPKRGWGSYSFGSESTGHFRNEGTVTVPEADVHLGTTRAGKSYFWVDITFGSLMTSADIEKWSVSYKVAGTYIELKQDANGNTIAVFPEAVAGGVVVTATYSTASVSDDFKYVFRKGLKDQDPIAFDEDAASPTRNSYNVALKLDYGTARTYSTTSEVDDVIVGLESAADGFYTFTDSQFGGIARTMTIQLKETAAADSDATTQNDPSTGWVQLRDPAPLATEPDQFTIWGQHFGKAQWFKSIAAAFHFTKKGSLKPDVSYLLPLAAYDVRIIATNAQDTAPDFTRQGFVSTADSDRFHSELYFASATELQRIGFVLPFHGDLTIQYNQDDLGANDLIEASFRGRKVWVPDAGATYDSTTLRPEPGSWKWSRNPVECAVDHIVGKRFGGGRFFTWADIDVTSFLAARDYCDASVLFDDGVTGARSECDIALAEDGERRSLGVRLAEILGGSETLAFWSGTWKFVIDQDADVVTDPVSSADFTIVEEDDLESADLDVTRLEQLPTELSITFRDRDKDGADESEPIILPDPQPTPRKVERVEFKAVQRRAQVRRVGKILLNQRRLQTWRIACVGTQGRGLRLFQLEPGDIVLFTSTRLGITAKKFRVMETAWSSDMKCVLLLTEHDPAAYRLPWQGPNSAVTPGLRPPPRFSGVTTSYTAANASGPPSASTSMYGPIMVRQLVIKRGAGKSKVGDLIG